jgi:hypothetical protein
MDGPHNERGGARVRGEHFQRTRHDKNTGRSVFSKGAPCQHTAHVHVHMCVMHMHMHMHMSHVHVHAHVHVHVHGMSMSMSMCIACCML